MATEEENMNSLFEGMVLFNSSQIPDSNDISPPQQSSSSSAPLDENLFSDLTLVTPLQPLSDPSPTTAAAVSTAEIPSVSRQVSRRKKKAGFRIGYGRDTSLSLDEPTSSSPSESHLQTPIQSDHPHAPPRDANSRTEIEVQERGNGIPKLEEPSEADSRVELASPPPAIETEVPEKSNPIPRIEIEVQERSNSISIATTEIEAQERSNSISIATTEIEAQERSNSMSKTEIQVQEKISAEEAETQDGAEVGGSIEKKLEQIRAGILEKLERIRGMVSDVSAARKEAARKRRKAAEDVNLTSFKYKQLEKELEEACEAEDFEKAERVSESLAAVEKDKESSEIALRDAEADCDSVDMKMKEVLELQIAAEEEGVLLLEQFSKEASDNADLILKNAEEHSSKEMDEWSSSMEALEVKKMELEIESHLINGARLGLSNSIKHAIENDTREKEILCKKRQELTEELEKLLVLVRKKEAEIAENDSSIQDVEKRISDVVSGFHDVQSNINTKYDDMQSVLSMVDLESEALSTKKKEIDDFLSQVEKRGLMLRELATGSMDEVREQQELVELRKSLALPIFKYREVKVRLAKTEEKILEEVQTLRQEASTARFSLQELSSTRSRIQQEIASAKQRIFFIDKRSPELEAEKKVAAAARNFKEAGRVAAEVKSLGVEKETTQKTMDAATLELEKLEGEINTTVKRLHETEELILVKEREAAMAGFERSRLVSAAAMAERSAALDLGDDEEASILLAEAQAADTEAAKLQEAYNLKEEDFGSIAKHLISIELIAKLGGKQLAEMAKSVSLSTA